MLSSLIPIQSYMTKKIPIKDGLKTISKIKRGAVILGAVMGYFTYCSLYWPALWTQGHTERECNENAKDGANNDGT